MFYFKTNFKLSFLVSLLSMVIWLGLPCFAQGRIAERLQRRFSQERQNKINPDTSVSYKQAEIAGLNVAIWEKRDLNSPASLVIFSHGFGGCNIQSKFIMEALANSDYLVLAPNHKDAFGDASNKHKERPSINFRDASQWNEKTYKDRHDDIIKLIAALKRDSEWNKRIDWSKVALCGHSWGGYTVLGLGGAWPSWKQPGIRAILALSPYCEPYILKGNLGYIDIPVMYQGGTRDFGITPTVKNLNGALNKTSSPAYFVEFDKLGHFGWTNFNKNKEQQDLINYYCLAFLDKYVKGNLLANPAKRLAGVSELRTK